MFLVVKFSIYLKTCFRNDTAPIIRYFQTAYQEKQRTDIAGKCVGKAIMIDVASRKHAYIILTPLNPTFI